MFRGGFQTVQHSYRAQWREEDLLYRESVRRRDCVEDERRNADEKATQLKILASLSSVLAVFSFTVLTNLTIVPDLAISLLILVALTSSSVVDTNSSCLLLFLLFSSSYSSSSFFHDFVLTFLSDL